jgi:hypothetical protein
MAEEILVKETLSDQMMAIGAELTRSLGRAQWPVVASFWLFNPERNDWRLLLASPKVDQDGPLASYRQVHEALHRMSTDLPLSSVSVVSDRDPIVRAVQSVYREDRETEIHRLFRTAINGVFIDDAYVYRVRPVTPAA